MASLFKRSFRSRDRDETADRQRYEATASALEDSIAETRREYDGLVQRIRLMTTAKVDSQVYGNWPGMGSKGDAPSTEEERELDRAVERTRRLHKQIELLEGLLKQLQDARAGGLF